VVQADILDLTMVAVEVEQVVFTIELDCLFLVEQTVIQLLLEQVEIVVEQVDIQVEPPHHH